MTVQAIATVPVVVVLAIATVAALIAVRPTGSGPTKVETVAARCG
jgi:hypothetical protein